MLAFHWHTNFGPTMHGLTDTPKNASNSGNRGFLTRAPNCLDIPIEEKSYVEKVSWSFLTAQLKWDTTPPRGN
jgi:hypothetical protein